MIVDMNAPVHCDQAALNVRSGSLTDIGGP